MIFYRFALLGFMILVCVNDAQSQPNRHISCSHDYAAQALEKIKAESYESISCALIYPNEVVQSVFHYEPEGTRFELQCDNDCQGMDVIVTDQESGRTLYEDLSLSSDTDRGRRSVSYATSE